MGTGSVVSLGVNSVMIVEAAMTILASRSVCDLELFTEAGDHLRSEQRQSYSTKRCNI